MTFVHVAVDWDVKTNQTNIMISFLVKAPRPSIQYFFDTAFSDVVHNVIWFDLHSGCWSQAFIWIRERVGYLFFFFRFALVLRLFAFGFDYC